MVWYNDQGQKYCRVSKHYVDPSKFRRKKDTICKDCAKALRMVEAIDKLIQAGLLPVKPQ